MTMAVAMQFAMSASSFLGSTTVVLNQVECPSTRSTLVVCQRESLERKTADHHVSRRFLAAASACATVLGVFTQPEAQAKRSKPPPAEEKKKVELEDKNLGKNEQRVLANARRKEAMKATVEAAKAKAKSISSPE